MRMLLLTYSGPSTARLEVLLGDACLDGYTVVAPARGAGRTGRREGTRTWPGETSILFSVVPEERLEPLVTILRTEAEALPPGERLHVAVLPVETFF